MLKVRSKKMNLTICLPAQLLAGSGKETSKNQRTPAFVWSPYDVHSTMSTARCPPYNVHRTLSTLRCPPYDAHRTMSHSTMSTVRCPMYNVHCTMSTARCPLYNVYRAMSSELVSPACTAERPAVSKLEFSEPLWLPASPPGKPEGW